MFQRLTFCLLLVFLSGYTHSQRSITAELADSIYHDLETGATESLFQHLIRGFEKAGYSPGPLPPVLVKQDYLTPLSKTTENVITQSELMTHVDQGYVYWENWAKLLGAEGWKPKMIFKNGQNAYMTGNYTIMVIMAHELGHYYSAANLGRGTDGEWENLADHFAVALINELLVCNMNLYHLYWSFRENIMDKLYHAIPREHRTTIPEDVLVYPYVYLNPLPTELPEYVSLQLTRMEQLINLPPLALSIIPDAIDEGIASISTNTELIQHYQKPIHFTEFDPHHPLSRELGNTKTNDIQVLENGEYYLAKLVQDSIQLDILTPEFRRISLPITSLQEELNTRINVDVFQDKKRPGMISFQNESNMVITAEINKKIYAIRCKVSDGAPRLVSMDSATISFPLNGKYSSNRLYYQSVSLPGALRFIAWSGTGFTNIEVTPSGITLEPMPVDTSRLLVTIDGKFQGINPSLVNWQRSIAIAPDGSVLWIEPNAFWKYMHTQSVVTLSGTLYSKTIGEPRLKNCSLLSSYSSKYGYLLYDHAKECATTMKLE